MAPAVLGEGVKDAVAVPAETAPSVGVAVGKQVAVQMLAQPINEPLNGRNLQIVAFLQGAFPCCWEKEDWRLASA
jgi:hypothetical protein